MSVDRIEEICFDGDYQDLLISAAQKEALQSIKEGREPKYLEDDEFPWLDIRIHAVVGKRKQWFKCQFRFFEKTDEEGWGMEIRSNHKGFSGQRFMTLIEGEIDTLAEGIWEFIKISIQNRENENLLPEFSTIYADRR